MVLVSDLPLQDQPNCLEISLLQAPEHDRHPSLSEWNRMVIEENTVCNAKALAARRKRTEIRCMKLLVSAHEEHVAEHSLKRAKMVPDALSGFEEHTRAPRGCELDKLTGVDTDMTSFMSSTSVLQKQDARNDDEGGVDLRSRQAVSGGGNSCPSHCIVSICGRSRVMEDVAIAVPSFLVMPSQVAVAAPARGTVHADTFHFFGVYDGHGGVQAAEFCKETLHGVLAEEMSVALSRSPSHLKACMQACFKRVDDELCGVCPHGSECPRTAVAGTTGSNNRCREPVVPGSVGTTAVVAVVGAHHVVVGNCGDSRAVLSRAGKAVQLSSDHKASRPDEIARIEAAGGHVFAWEGHRVCGVLSMSRALGDGFLKPFVSGQPEVTITERTDNDECLILASDGLWDVLSSKYVCSVARKVMVNWRRQHPNFQDRYPLFAHHSEGQEQALSSNVDVEDSPAQVVAAILVKLALAKNSKDNISVVVVDLNRL